MTAPQAREYHALQAEALAGSDVDFLYVPTFPAVAEALGACQTIGATGLPYVISFVLWDRGYTGSWIRTSGELPSRKWVTTA